ncbi:nucleotide-binding domain-containing protein [Sporosarcina sp. G11-34]|uniref:nucleotide-binding domain-containing protein n=1 Tax=Sporosarcina sp. G11-34 TaxID=2849605 RepID=UPI0022A94CAC|nr:hypothetical protein [Sporosarcina sp. G11-34]MCZ2259422.1 hypothetical protein [Sporosarcina sp. G11-34]
MRDLHSTMLKFHNDEVKLSESEKSRLTGFKDINIKRLKDGLAEINKEKSKNYFLADHVVQGSVSMRTVTQNDEYDYDIDVAVIFDKENLPASALDSRKLVEEALAKKCTKFVNPPKAGKNAVRVQYQEGYHIDFAVYRRFKNEHDEYDYEHAGPMWSKRHPKSIRDWFNTSVATNSPNPDNDWVTVEKNQMRRIVRIFKMFCRSRSNWSLPGGVILSTLVQECYVPHNTRDDQSLYDTLNAIKNRIILSNNVDNPTDSTLSLTSKESHRKKVTKLKDYLEDKLKYLDVLFKTDCTDEQAKKAWGKFFKNTYWSDSIQKSAATESAHFASQYPESYSLDVRFQMYSENQIHPITYKQSRKGKQLSPKMSKLMFEAIHNVPAPYEILWEVNNSGDEATEAAQLYHQRRKHFSEGNYNWESTAFKGTHTMTASIVKNGHTVIKRTVEVQVI